VKSTLHIRALNARAVAAPMKRPLATSTGKRCKCLIANGA
jgi:hypothetical protein